MPTGKRAHRQAGDKTGEDMPEHLISSTVFYPRPGKETLRITHGQGIYLYDEAGKHYIDCSGAAVILGHGRADVAAALETLICQEGAETVAAFIAEPVVSAALAAVPAPQGYFQKIREICDRYGVLLIVDEVMTSIGRTGKNFAIEHWEVTPDIIATAKGISGAYFPLGIVIAHERVIKPLLDLGQRFIRSPT